MSLPSYFKQVKEEVLEAEDPIKRVANPFNDVTYEVVVNKKGVVTGDPMDYVARKMTGTNYLPQLGKGRTFSQWTCSSERPW
jgi:hypothetical protein